MRVKKVVKAGLTLSVVLAILLSTVAVSRYSKLFSAETNIPCVETVYVDYGETIDDGHWYYDGIDDMAAVFACDVWIVGYLVLPAEIEGHPLYGIGYYTFRDYTALTGVEFPDGFANLNPYAFWGCYNIESVKIPKSMEWIGEFAFAGCSGLSDVYYSGTEAEWNNIEIGDGNEDLLNANIHFSNGSTMNPNESTADSANTATPSAGKPSSNVTPNVSTVKPDGNSKTSDVVVDSDETENNNINIDENNNYSENYEEYDVMEGTEDSNHKSLNKLLSNKVVRIVGIIGIIVIFVAVIFIAIQVLKRMRIY